jgi:addiction module RelE/StbE family toxin
MKYRVIFKPSTERDLERIPDKKRRRIFTAINLLALDPYSGKKLDGKYKKYYCIRVWPYRILYYPHKEKRIIVIFRVGHRQGVY